VFGAQDVGLQEALVLQGVGAPFVQGLADDAADLVPHGLAFHLPVEHRQAHELRRIARGVADLHPAGRLGADGEVADVLLVLHRARPQELAVVGAFLHVALHAHRLGHADAF